MIRFLTLALALSGLMFFVPQTNSFAADGNNQIVFCQKFSGIPGYVRIVDDESQCFKRERAIVLELGNGNGGNGNGCPCFNEHQIRKGNLLGEFDPEEDLACVISVGREAEAAEMREDIPDDAISISYRLILDEEGDENEDRGKRTTNGERQAVYAEATISFPDDAGLCFHNPALINSVDGGDNNPELNASSTRLHATGMEVQFLRELSVLKGEIVDEETYNACRDLILDYVDELDGVECEMEM